MRPDAGDGAQIEAATACLIDEVRREHHLRPLRTNRYLQTVAGARVSQMVRWSYFADDGPAGQTPWTLIVSTPYGARAASVATGQNIGWATGSDATPASMVAAWMASPGHRQIILTGEFRDIGVGVSAALPPALGRGRTGATYAVEFAERVLRLGSRAPARGARHAAGLGAGL